MPEFQTYDRYKYFIQHLDVPQNPEIYGFHSNADIVRAINETEELCGSLLNLLGSQDSAGKG